MRAKSVIFFFLISLLAQSCSTTVRIVSQPAGAKAYVNGRYLGETPVEVDRSDFVFEQHAITLRKKGYREVNSIADKEVKVGPVIGGLLVFIPFLWCYGPEDEQKYLLEPEGQ